MSTANVTQTGGAATVTVTVSRGLKGDTGATGAPGTTDYNELDNVPSEFPPEAHTHPVSDITPISSGKLVGRHGGGSGAGQECGLDGGLEFHGANIRREALTGDVTASAGSNSTTIANDAVTNAKLANVPTATIKGRITAGTGDPEDLTPAQAIEVIGAATPASAAAQIAFSTRTSRRRAFRLLCLGDSITDQNSSLLYGFESAGPVARARALLRGRLEMVPRVFSAHSSNGDWDFGYGAYSASDVLNGKTGVFPMSDIKAAYQDTDAVFVHLGSNPAGSVAATVAAITAIWDAIIADGLEVFAAEVLPRAASFGAGVAADIIAVNAALASEAESRNIPLLTWHGNFADGSGYCSTALFSDGVHPNATACQRLAVLLADFLDPLIGGSYLRLPDPKTAWLTGNPYFTGDDASVPTAWTAPAEASAYAVTLDAEGRWKRITNTNSPATYTVSTYRQTSGVGTWKIGDRVRGVCRIRGVASGWDFKAVELRMVKTGGTTESIYAHHTFSASSEPSIMDVYGDQYLITPEYVIPSTATAMFTYLNLYGSGSVDVQCCGILPASYFY